MRDLIEENGVFIDYNEACLKSNNTLGFMQYCGILQIISTKWKRYLRSESDSDLESDIEGSSW